MNEAMLDLRARLELISKQYPMLSAVGAGIDKAIREIDAMLVAAPKPEAQAAGVEAYLVERLRGTGYGLGRRVVDAAKYDPTSRAFWTGPEAQSQHRVTPLVPALSTPASHDAQQPKEVEKLQRQLAREESDHARTIDQRDAAEDALGRMFQAVTGREAEWSSAWCYVDAVEEAAEHVAALAQQPVVVGDGVDEAEVDAVYQRLRDVGLRILTRDQVCAAFKEQADHDAALTPAATPGDFRDAYEGAREDLLDWKGRAQRAEARLRSMGWQGITASEPPAAQKEGNGNG